jgi:hypothetical protein
MSDAPVELVDAEVVEDAGLVPAAPSATLFRTNDPAEVIARATAAADVLKNVLTRQGLTTRIGNKEHVNVEGWQTCGAMLGVSAVKEWVKPIAWPADEFLTDALRAVRGRGLVFGYESSYAAQTFAGQRIGAAEAACKRTEEKWLTSDDYALESMAQTRATSKAMSAVLRWIVTLAGYSGTPAEEMTGGGFQRASSRDFTVTDNQIHKFILPSAKRKKISDADLHAILRVRFGVERVEDLPRKHADDLVTAFDDPVPTVQATAEDSDVPPDTDGLPVAGAPVEPGVDVPFE